MAEQKGGPVAGKTEGAEKQSVEETGEAIQPVTAFTQRERPVIDASGTAGAVALDVTASHGNSAVSLRIENPYVAAGAIAGGIGAGLGALVCLKLDSSQLVEVARGFSVGVGVASVAAVTYLWMTKRGPTETAIRNSLEGRPAAGAHARDPEVEGIRRGSLLVKIRCHSRESLVHFIQDYESGEVKLRLEGELSKIGFTDELIVTIENMEELDKQIKTSNVPPSLPSVKQRSLAVWSPHQARRLGMEKVIVSKYFRRRVKWIHPRDRENAMVESTMTTSNDKNYKLRIYIPRDYPNSCPSLVVCSPSSLRKRDGSLMTRETSEDHTYGSRDGLPVICHFRPSWWTGTNTLYQVFMKGLLWLEAYEGHLRTGNPLSTYLRECSVY